MCLHGGETNKTKLPDVKNEYSRWKQKVVTSREFKYCTYTAAYFISALLIGCLRDIDQRRCTEGILWNLFSFKFIFNMRE